MLAKPPVAQTTGSSATAERERVVPHEPCIYRPKNMIPWATFADSMGLASVNLMQSAPKAAILCEITRNDGHWGAQGHSRSPISVPIETPFATS